MVNTKERKIVRESCNEEYTGIRDLTPSWMPYATIILVMQVAMTVLLVYTAINQALISERIDQYHINNQFEIMTCFVSKPVAERDAVWLQECKKSVRENDR